MENEEVEFAGDVRAHMKGAYIAAIEFEGRKPTFTIRATTHTELERQKAGSEADGGRTKMVHVVVVRFHETQRGWVLNKTNAQLMFGMFGPDSKNWRGKRVTLGAEMVQFGPTKVLGIRVLGSPDLASDKKVTVKLPKKRPTDFILLRTVAQHREPVSTPAEPTPSAPGIEDRDLAELE